jgi:CheY-like chemotaxis protein
MVNGLLSLARRTPVENRVLDLNELLREEVFLLERTTLARTRLELDLAPDLRPTRGDAAALAHAFMNLFVNAVDAMPEGGTLALGSRNLDDGWIEIRVEDTGCGMAPDVLERALDPFFTTKGPGRGTGLGLTLAYGAAKSHRGALEVESEPGRGTRVRIRLPACEPGGAEAPELPAAAVPAGARLQVLVVDDDDLVRTSLKAILGTLGHDALAVDGGEEALATLAAGYRPDLMILDMNMPGLGGAGTLSRLRALRPDLPVLLATGRVDELVLALVEASPQVVLLPKPFGLEELRKHLAPLRPLGPS